MILLTQGEVFNWKKASTQLFSSLLFYQMHSQLNFPPSCGSRILRQKCIKESTHHRPIKNFMQE